MKDWMKITIVVICMIVFVSGSTIVIGYSIVKPSCRIRAEKMNKPYSYGIMQGCMIHTDKYGWIPIESYRVFE